MATMGRRYIFIDIETTGLYHQSGDKIVEIACFYHESDNTRRIFKYYVNPEREISPKAISIHRITNEMVKDSPKFSQIGQELLDFVRGAVLVGHNIRNFDIPFINSELKASNLELISNQLVDTLDMYRARFPGLPARLDDVCEMFEIDLNERNDLGHGALLDAKLTAACFSRMIA